MKEDLYGKVKDFINRYANDGSKIEEESQKNKQEGDNTISKCLNNFSALDSNEETESGP